MIDSPSCQENHQLLFSKTENMSQMQKSGGTAWKKILIKDQEYFLLYLKKSWTSVGSDVDLKESDTEMEYEYEQYEMIQEK